MSKRLLAFHSFRICPVRRAMYNKLDEDERLECEQFIKANDHLSYQDFSHLLNRWYLDKPDQRPSRYFQMCGLLSEANGATVERRKRGEK